MAAHVSSFLPLTRISFGPRGTKFRSESETVILAIALFQNLIDHSSAFFLTMQG